MPVPLYHVDAFTGRAFAGNPAAVCLLDRPAGADWMQSVGAEMNLSETAFLWPEGEVSRLRWFTPTVEVALCGHATLASAHVLWESGRLPLAATARFATRSGELRAARRGAAIELDFPAQPATAVDPPPGLLAALGCGAVFVGRSRDDYLVEVEDDAAVRGLAPDHAALARLPVRGVIVTARSAEPAFDFVSRFFAPGSGVAEDPVTGSAHCCLAVHWAAKLGRSAMTGYQASLRGGVVGVRLAGERVFLAGEAVTVVRGELQIPPA